MSAANNVNKATTPRARTQPRFHSTTAIVLVYLVLACHGYGYLLRTMSDYYYVSNRLRRAAVKAKAKATTFKAEAKADILCLRQGLRSLPGDGH